MTLGCSQTTTRRGVSCGRPWGWAAVTAATPFTLTPTLSLRERELSGSEMAFCKGLRRERELSGGEMAFCKGPPWETAGVMARTNNNEHPSLFPLSPWERVGVRANNRTFIWNQG